VLMCTSSRILTDNAVKLFILKRWTTGIAALPFLFLMIYKGGSLFSVSVSVICFWALWEYFRIVFNTKGKTISGIILLIGLIVGPVIIWTAYKNALDFIIIIVAFNLIISGLFTITQFKSDPFILENFTKQILGIIYIPILLSFLILIRSGTDGMLWIFSLLFVVFAGDIGAFYVGSYLGRHKLCPSVSPKKTIEGSIGGLTSNLVVGVLFNYFFLSYLPLGTSIFLFLFIGIAGQTGDLFESALKRSANIKDSGSILPGHGGILDRIDALLFAAPVAYFFKEFIFC